MRLHYSSIPEKAKQGGKLVNPVLIGWRSMSREFLGGLPINDGTIIEAKELKQISNDSAIGEIVDQVLLVNTQQVADYRAGKEKAFNSLIGQIMKATQGRLIQCR